MEYHIRGYTVILILPFSRNTNYTYVIFICIHLLQTIDSVKQGYTQDEAIVMTGTCYSIFILRACKKLSRHHSGVTIHL